MKLLTWSADHSSASRCGVAGGVGWQEDRGLTSGLIPGAFPPPLPRFLCVVGGGGGLCLAAGTSQKSCPLNRHHFLIPGMQTALSLGRERRTDQLSPTVSFQTLAGPSLGLAPSCLLARSGRLSASALLHRPGRLAARQGQAHVSGHLGEGEGRVSREACGLVGREQVKLGHLTQGEQRDVRGLS